MLQMVSLMEDVLEHPLRPLQLDTEALSLEPQLMDMEDMPPPWVVRVLFQSPVRPYLWEPPLTVDTVDWLEDTEDMHPQ
jgi:hypothetical protein